MKVRLSIALGMSALALGCSGGNQAASKQFNYGAAQPATSTQASSVDGTLGTASSQASSPSLQGALAISASSAYSDALLGTSGVSVGSGTTATVFASSRMATGRTALMRAVATTQATGTSSGAGFDNAACATVSSTSVTLNNCTITINDSTNGTTTTGKITANGSLNKTGTGAFDWNFTVSATISSTSGSSSMSVNGSDHVSGNIAVTSTTYKGTWLASLSASVSGNGVSEKVGLDEAVTADLTYQTSPTTCVTGGTLEAKRVWTARPTNTTAAQLPDAAAKITWTGCDAAQIQLSI